MQKRRLRAESARGPALRKNCTARPRTRRVKPQTRPLATQKTLTGIAQEIFQLWSDYLKPRGYRIRYQIVDFPGGMPGDIAITLSWDG